MPWERSGCGLTLMELLPSWAGRKAASDRPACARPVPWGQGHREGSQSVVVIGASGWGCGVCTAAARAHTNSELTGQQLWALNPTPSRCPELPVSTLHTHSISRYTCTLTCGCVNPALHKRLGHDCKFHVPLTVSLCPSQGVMGWISKL